MRRDRYYLSIDANKSEFLVDYNLETSTPNQVINGEKVLLLCVGRQRQNVLSFINVMVLRRTADDTFGRIGFAEVRSREIPRRIPTAETPSGEPSWRGHRERTSKLSELNKGDVSTSSKNIKGEGQLYDSMEVNICLYAFATARSSSIMILCRPTKIEICPSPCMRCFLSFSCGRCLASHCP